MKNISKLCLATLAGLASMALVHAQNTNPQSGLTSPNMDYYSNQNYQPNMSQTGQDANSWSKQNQANQSYQNPTNPNSYTDQQARQNMNYNNTRNQQPLVWTDNDVAQRIQWAIRGDKKLSSLAKSVEIDVKNYNVTLTGTVATEDEKDRMSMLTRQIRGVKSVSNNLLISRQ